MKLTTIFAAFAALAAVPAAQTTGVPGVNEYIVNGTLAGSTSCTNVAVPGGGPTIFEVSTAPNVPVVLLFTPFCPCRPCTFPLPPQPLPIPATACFNSNQSLDILLSPNCPVITMGSTSDAFGFTLTNLTLPPGWIIGTQAAIVHPGAVGWPVVFSQAYTIVT